MMKGKQMETTAECWQALLDNKALIHEHGISPVELVEGWLCWGDGRPTEMSFNCPPPRLVHLRIRRTRVV